MGHFGKTWSGALRESRERANAAEAKLATVKGLCDVVNAKDPWAEKGSDFVCTIARAALAQQILGILK